MDVHLTLVLPKNVWGLARCRNQKDDKLKEMWEKMGAEIKSSFLTMLHFTPEYIVVLAIQQKL